MKELAVIAEKMKNERLKIVVDNEKHIVEEEARRKKKGDDSEEGDEDGFVDEDDDDDSDGNLSANDDEEATLSKIAKLRKEGKTLEGGADEDLAGDDNDEDDEDDSDYEYTAGDLAIYDSALDDVDELIYIRTALEQLNTMDPIYTS